MSLSAQPLTSMRTTHLDLTLFTAVPRLQVGRTLPRTRLERRARLRMPTTTLRTTDVLERVPIRHLEGFACLRVQVIQETVDSVPQRAIPLRAVGQWPLADIHAQALADLTRNQPKSNTDGGHEAKPCALACVVQGELQALVGWLAFAFSFHSLPPPVVRRPTNPFLVRCLELLIVGV